MNARGYLNSQFKMFNDDETKLSIEELRAFEGYKNISDNDAIEIIDGLYRLSQFTYYIINK